MPDGDAGLAARRPMREREGAMWDPETERRAEEALELFRRPSIFIDDYHPWEPPALSGLRVHRRPQLRILWRLLARVVAFALALDVVVRASRQSGLDRLGL